MLVECCVSSARPLVDDALIAATHLPIVLGLGPVIGLTARLVAAVTSIPFGYLYDRSTSGSGASPHLPSMPSRW